MTFSVRILAAISLPVMLAASAGAQAGPADTTSPAAASPAAASPAAASPAAASRRRATFGSNADSTPPWITRRELVAGGISILATLAVAPLDRPVSTELQEAHWQGNEPLHSASQALAFAGGPGPFVLGAGLFAVGRLTGTPAFAGAGIHVTEAVLLAAALTGLGKGIAGRALPGVATSENFAWGRGFHKGNGPFVSFPSGHTAAAFAMVSALTVEAGNWRPGLERYVGPLAYGTASAIGIARLYQHVHWVSDLPLAAAIGTWSGLSVESHTHHGSRCSLIRRVAELTTVGAGRDGGMLLGLSIPFVAQAR